MCDTKVNLASNSKKKNNTLITPLYKMEARIRNNQTKKLHEGYISDKAFHKAKALDSFDRWESASLCPKMVYETLGSGEGPIPARAGLSVAPYCAAQKCGEDRDTCIGCRWLEKCASKSCTLCPVKGHCASNWTALHRQRFDLIVGSKDSCNYSIRRNAGKIEVNAKMAISRRKQYITERGDVSEFSKKSQKNLFDRLLSIDQEKMPTKFIREITLTYPSEFPDDGKICKAHMDAFVKRLWRKYGKTSFIWKREFQKRGAPHYHLMVFFGKVVDLVELRKFVASSWYEVVTSGDYKHLLAGTECDVIKNASKFAFYLSMYLAKDKGEKEYQNKVPVGYKNAGRFWGVVGRSNISLKADSMAINEEQYWKFKKAARNYWISNGLPVYGQSMFHTEVIEFDGSKLDKMVRSIVGESRLDWGIVVVDTNNEKKRKKKNIEKAQNETVSDKLDSTIADIVIELMA